MRMYLFACVAINSILFVQVAQAQPAATQPSPMHAHVGEVNLSDVRLSVAIETLRDRTREAVVVNWTALEATGIERKSRVTVELPDATLGEALKAVCNSIDPHEKGLITLTNDDGVLYVSTAQDAEKHAKVTPFPPRGDEAMATQTVEALQRPLPEINFNQIAASDVIAFLKDITQLSIDVNWDALNEVGAKKDTPVTMRIRDLPLERALRMLAEELGGSATEPVSYVVDGDKILISTARDLAK